MYEQYANDIFRYLYVHLRNHQLAEDLTSDTFTKAWMAFDSFDSKQPRPWLYKIARNLMTDHWRKKSTALLDETEEITSDAEPIDEQIDKKLTSEKLQQALLRLPADMRSVVTLRFLQCYSARQTGEALNLSEANVRVIQYRALKKLKGLL